MNTVFRIVFNTSRGQTMVVNENTSSVQTGKKAAVTVALVGALASGVAMAGVTGTVDSGTKTWTESDLVTPTGRTYKVLTGANGTSNVPTSIVMDVNGQTFTENRVFGFYLDKPDNVTLGSMDVSVKVVDTSKKVMQARGYSQLGGSATFTGNVEFEVQEGTQVSDWTNAVNVFDGGSVTFGGEKTKLVTNNKGYSAQGIQVYDGSKVYFTGDDVEIITASDYGANGIASGGSGNTYEFTNNGDVTIKTSLTDGLGANAMGIMLNDDTLNVAGSVDKFKIEVSGSGVENAGSDGTAGLYTSGTTTIDAESLEISVKAGVDENGNEIASVPGDYAKSYGIRGDGAKFQVSSDSKIDVTDPKGDVRGIGLSGGESAFTGDLDVDVQGAGNVRGINTLNEAKLSIGSEGSKTQISAESTAGDAIGLVAFSGADLDIGGDLFDIKAKGNAYVAGIHVQGNLTQPLPDISITAEQTNIDVEDGSGDASGIAAMSGGKLTIEKGLKIDAEGKNAISARGDAEVTIEGNGLVEITGDILFDYDAETSGTPVDAKIDIDLQKEGSFLKGNISQDTDAGAGDVSGMSLGLGEGTSWQSSKRSFVNKMKLNGGTIDISENDEGIEIKDSLEGKGDVLVDAEGQGTVDVGNGADKGAELTVKTTQNADEISEEAAKGLVERVKGVQNRSAFVDEGLVKGPMSVDSEGKVTTGTNSVMSNVLDLASNSALALNRTALNDVRKRLGDLRAVEGASGAWARYNGGELSGDRGFESKFNTIQVGYDTKFTSEAPRVGMAFSYTKADSDMLRGSADMTAYSLAAYSTWMADNGLFVDVIGRVATAETDVDVNVTGPTSGSFDKLAYSLSGEVGWRFNVTETFYVEPQAELTYTYIDSDKLKMSGGGVYELDAVDSLIGRVGFAAGFKCPSNFGDVYVRASAVHEFLGDATITGKTARGATGMVELDGEDTWVEFGIGANFNVNKNTYVYADIERTEGATLDEDWRANVGVRFAF